MSGFATADIITPMKHNTSILRHMIYLSALTVFCFFPVNKGLYVLYREICHFYLKVEQNAPQPGKGDRSLTPHCIGVGAQSTLGQDIFARKNMHEKLTKCPNFARYMPEKKNNKMPKFYTIFARKIFFPIFFLGGGGKCPPRLLRLCPIVKSCVRHCSDDSGRPNSNIQ